MTQKERVLEYLEANGTISAYEATRMHPAIMALHSRISDLRRDGHDIATKYAPSYTDENGAQHGGYWYYAIAEASA